MIPWTIVAVLLGSAAALVVVAVLIKRFGTLLNKGIPLPLVGLIVVALLAGGGVYVSRTLREPKREPREGPPSEAPPGMANMTANMARSKSGAPPRDTRPALVELVRKLESLAVAGNLEIDDAQRADLKTQLREIASASQIPTVVAWTRRGDLERLFTDDQLQKINAAKPESLNPQFDYAADYGANPFKDGPTKDSIDALLGWLEKDGK